MGNDLLEVKPHQEGNDGLHRLETDRNICRAAALINQGI